MAIATTDRPVRVRIAPSPTGDPHVGTAYIGLFNYCFARSQGGKFVLRIEDTDQARSRADSERMIFEALRWVGLEWDEGPDVGGDYGPYRQSERKQIHLDHAAMLIESERAYRCFCTSERLEELRQQQREAKHNPGYDGLCRAVTADESQRRAEAGESFVIRLAVPQGGRTRYVDRLRGEVEFENDLIDDQVLIKSDGFPTYHLANVVDDHLMEISHVIRGEEWMTSTPKHVLLYAAFGWNEPVWVHMPLLRNKDKSKLSKRKNPVSINYYRDAGIVPEALLNFLGTMGWSFGGDREIFSLAEMVAVFDWERMSLGGPVFENDKLSWMNEQYIHALPDEGLVDALLGWRFSRDHLLALAPLVRERIKRLDDFIGVADFFFAGDLDLTPVADKLVIPEVASKDVRKALLLLIEKYEALETWEAEGLEGVSRAFCDETGWKAKHVFMLIRLLITGRKASPGLFETMEVLGKELARRRLRVGAEFIGSMK
jgi:glutamyl-tRNA synthetase